MNLSSMASMLRSPFSIVSSAPSSSFGSSSWQHSWVSSYGPHCPMAEFLGMLLRTRLHWPYLPLKVQGSAGTLSLGALCQMSPAVGDVGKPSGHYIPDV